MNMNQKVAKKRTKMHTDVSESSSISDFMVNALFNMWDLFNLRRRTRRRTQRASDDNSTSNENVVNTQTEGPSLVARALTGVRSVTQPFFIPTHPFSESPPKCISRLPCSQILYGERVEDFSTDCWLEDHLHRFGLPANAPLDNSNRVSRSSPLYENNDDSVTGSSESNNSLIGYFDLEIGNELQFTQSRPRLALEQLFLPLDDTDLNASFECTDDDLIEPPPYSEFDPPPSYEEAIQHSERRSTGTRSSHGSSLAFMW